MKELWHGLLTVVIFNTAKLTCLTYNTLVIVRFFHCVIQWRNKVLLLILTSFQGSGGEKPLCDRTDAKKFLVYALLRVSKNDEIDCFLWTACTITLVVCCFCLKQMTLVS